MNRYAKEVNENEKWARSIAEICSAARRMSVREAARSWMLEN